MVNVDPSEVPDSERLYEIVDGKKVFLPLRTVAASDLANRLGRHLYLHPETDQLGRVLLFMLYHLPLEEDRNRRPGTSFVSFERWPSGKRIDEYADAWDVVPDLVAEVLGPDDYVEEIVTKIDEYFRAGVRLVWVVYPRHRLVYVYESPTRVRILTRADEIDGGPVLPSFRLSLATLFPEGVAAPE